MLIWQLSTCRNYCDISFRLYIFFAALNFLSNPHKNLFYQIKTRCLKTVVTTDRNKTVLLSCLSLFLQTAEGGFSLLSSSTSKNDPIHPDLRKTYSRHYCSSARPNPHVNKSRCTEKCATDSYRDFHPPKPNQITGGLFIGHLRAFLSVCRRCRY